MFSVVTAIPRKATPLRVKGAYLKSGSEPDYVLTYVTANSGSDPDFGMNSIAIRNGCIA
jgi:hypothetical protein